MELNNGLLKLRPPDFAGLVRGIPHSSFTEADVHPWRAGIQQNLWHLAECFVPAKQGEEGEDGGSSGSAAGKEEEPECGFCKFMKEGDCGAVFENWEKCVDVNRNSTEGFVQSCMDEVSGGGVECQRLLLGS